MSNINKFNLPGLLKKYPDGILIPKIQRDYAQGRADAKASDVRKNFLNAIFEGKVKSLDFIFGTVDDRNRFIPIDGQQRLTTLFLLYLYAKKTKELYKDLDLSKFSYDTRRAARDFCKAVVENKWDIKDRLEGDSVSYSIKISNWFMDYWQYDPTVSSMLIMLDAIHKKAGDYDFKKLNDTTFYFHDMEEHKLNENLYVKMNSRGKPLTSFENMKASIEKLLEEKDENGNPIISPQIGSFDVAKDTPSGDTFKDKWKYYIDRDWTDWFWKNTNKDSNPSIDVEFLQFICRFLAGYTRIFGDAEKTNKEIQDALCINAKVDTFIPFEPVKSALVNGAFEALAKVLMGFSCNGWSELTVSNWGEKITKIDEYKSLAVIHGYLIAGENDKERRRWLRFCWNMAENYVTSAEAYLTFCNHIRNIRDNGTDLYSALAKLVTDNSSAQLLEEVAKAKQILHPRENVTRPYQPVNWELAIMQAENYAFFRGAIRFLFTDENGEICWSDFDKKWENAQNYFDENGVCNDYYKDARLLRSFIAHIDYWPKDYGHWNCFKVNCDKRDASSWREILLGQGKYVHSLLLNGCLSDEDLVKFVSALGEEDAEYCQNTLVRSKILDKVVPRTRIRWNWGNFVLYPNNSHDGYNHYYISKRNDILRQIDKNNLKISRYNIIDGTDVLLGDDISFLYKHYLFRWQWTNWVDMYEGDEKLYDRGVAYQELHTEYHGNGNHSFNDPEELTKELNRCIEQYKLLEKSNPQNQ